MKNWFAPEKPVNGNLQGHFSRIKGNSHSIFMEERKRGSKSTINPS
jgi:hypothetical protein